MTKRFLQCPNCLAKYNVDEAVVGKTVGCSKCNSSFTAELFPYLVDELLETDQGNGAELEGPVRTPKENLTRPAKKKRSLFGKLKLIYFVCVFPLVLIFSIGPMLRQDNQKETAGQLQKYLSLIPGERAKELSAKLELMVSGQKAETADTVNTVKTTNSVKTRKSYLAERSIHRDRVKHAEQLRAQGKPLLEAWTHAGLIVEINVQSGDVRIDHLVWESWPKTQQRIDLVKRIGSQLQSKINIPLKITLYCSRTGKRLGIFHPGAEISVFE